MSENIQNTQPTNQTPIQGATKKCKHCQSDIPKKAKVCPICRKKQGGILKWIVIIFVALIIIGIIGSISDGNTKENNSSNPSSQASTPSKEVNGLTEEKYNAIENGEFKPSLQLIPKKQSKFALIIRAIKKLIFGEAKEDERIY